MGRKYLTRAELEAYSGQKDAYLRCRLPYFTGFNMKWAHHYLKQRWCVRDGYPQVAYSLTKYGLRFLLKVDNNARREVQEALIPLWSRY